MAANLGGRKPINASAIYTAQPYIYFRVFGKESGVASEIGTMTKIPLLFNFEMDSGLSSYRSSRSAISTAYHTGWKTRPYGHTRVHGFVSCSLFFFSRRIDGGRLEDKEMGGVHVTDASTRDTHQRPAMH
jgi:hypothetical protein